jgi:hypothetical protein
MLQKCKYEKLEGWGISMNKKCELQFLMCNKCHLTCY